MGCDIMGRLDIVIPDELENDLRIEIIKRFGGRKGDLSKAITSAIELWIKVPTIAEMDDLLKKVSKMKSEDREKLLESMKIKSH